MEFGKRGATLARFRRLLKAAAWSIIDVLVLWFDRTFTFPKLSDGDLFQLIASVPGPDYKPTSVEEWEVLTHRVLLHDPLVERTMLMSGLKRARPHEAGKDADYESVSDVWYPEPRHVEKMGRLNEKGKPRLYASEDGIGALLEMHPKPGDVFTILVIVPKTPLPLRTTYVGLAKSVAGITQRTDAPAEIVYQRLRASMTPKAYERLMLVERWFNRLITLEVAVGDEAQYLPTVGLANMLLKPIPGFSWARTDVVQYPSVAGRFVGDNVCMATTTADRFFRPYSAWKVRYVGLDASANGEPPAAIVQPIKRSHVIDNGEIRWYAPGEHFSEEAFRMIFGRHRNVIVVQNTGS